MKKQRSRKPGRSRPNLQRLTTATNHKTTKQQPKAIGQDKAIKEDTKTEFGTVWKSFWSYMGPIITVYGLIAGLWPTINITAGVNLDPAQTFQTQFIVTNSGRVPVHGISFACALIGDHVNIGELRTSVNSLAPVATLLSGEAVARNCFANSISINGPILKVQAYYHWPLIGRTASTAAYFRAQPSSSGFALVQEAAPVPEPAHLIEVGSPPEK